MVSGVLTVLACQSLRPLRLTVVDRLQDRLVFVPHGAAGREAVEHRADFIDLGDRLRLERRHPQATATGIDDEAILLEQTQRLQHWLTRDVKRSSEFLLGEARTGD